MIIIIIISLKIQQEIVENTARYWWGADKYFVLNKTVVDLDNVVR